MTLLHRTGSLRISDGQLVRAIRSYRAAHRSFAAGHFADAEARLAKLGERLAPDWERLRSRDAFLARDAVEIPGDVNDRGDGSAERWLSGSLQRLQTREGQLRAVCAAVMHDRAMLLRHRAEQYGESRRPDVVARLLAMYGEAISVYPWMPALSYDRAGYLDSLGEYQLAREGYEALLELVPRSIDGWTQLGNVYCNLGDRSAANEAWKRALRFADDKPDGYWPVAVLRLKHGDYARGWKDYEGRLVDRLHLDRFARNDLRAPAWDGTPFDGTLLLYAEQGYGDTIQMSRYVPMVAECCPNLILEVGARSLRLFQAMFPDVDVRLEHTTPSYDRVCSLWSCPAVFGLDSVDAVPPPVQWRPREAEPGRIGVCWAGSPGASNDLQRSMTVEEIAPIMDALIERGDAVQSLRYGVETPAPVEPIPEGDFLDTAHAVARCERVITVDTSIAHLAGTMGIDTRLMLPFSSEWRWLMDRDDSPWYPGTMKLYRQPSPGDWGDVITRVLQDLP